MRHRPVSLLVAALVALSLLAVPAGAEVRRVTWNEDPAWKDVLAAAAADSGSSILIHFHAPWCGPCRLLDAFVYNEPEVVDELADVIAVKFDIDRPENSGLKERFVVERLPTLVWCAPDGSEVNRFVGYRSAPEFLDEVGRFRLLEHSSLTLAARLSADPEDEGLLLEMADLEARRGRSPRARILYLRATNEREDPVARTRALLGLAMLAQRAGRAAEARDRGREASRTGAAWTEVVAFQEAVGDSAGLLETYRRRAAADDMDVIALDGFARTALVLDVEMEEAGRCALRATVLSDREPEMMATLAECYHRHGRHRKAIRWLGDALVENPDLPAVRAAVFRARLAAYEAALAEDPHGVKTRYRRSVR